MVYYIFGVISTIAAGAIGILAWLLVCANRKIRGLTGAVAQLTHFLESNYFTQGIIDLNPEEIELAYRGVMVIFNIEDADYGEVYDVSKVESDNLIVISMASPGVEEVKCILPNCDVFRTKDGFWYWRESEEEELFERD